MKINDSVKVLGNVLFDHELVNIKTPWLHKDSKLLGKMLQNKKALIPDLRKIITLLVNAGADINEKHDHDFTPLLLCAETGDCEIFEELASMGGDLSAKTEDGQTVYSIANELYHFQLANLLMRKYPMV